MAPSVAHPCRASEKPLSAIRPLSCLIVSADPQRVHDAMHELTRRVQRPRCEIAVDSLHAVRRVMHGGLDLSLVDLAIDGAVGPALVRHLHRMHPAMDVLAFDDIEAVVPAPGQAAEGWSWAQLPVVLDHWLALHPQAGLRCV